MSRRMTPSRELWDTLSREEKVVAIRAARKEGKTWDTLAADWGISKQTATNLGYDPDGSKQKRRRQSWSGICMDCGAPTHANSKKDISRRCAVCWAKKGTRVWTQERVVEALQRWAVEHGRPPTATDWAYRETRGDGYPSFGGVYGPGSNGAFASWADAVEAAGFPRPQIGKYDRSRKKKYVWGRDFDSPPRGERKWKKS